MINSCKAFLLLFFLFASLANAAYDPNPIPEVDTVYVAREKSSTNIIVVRGCSENVFPVSEEIGENETQEQLLARVYGSEPLADSSAVYKAWADSCKRAESRSRSGVIIYSLTMGALSTGMGALLFFPDFDNNVVKGIGKVVGGGLMVTGGLYLAVSLATLVVSVFAHDAPSEKVSTYNQQAEKWKLRVTPTINFNEPGGGLILQLGF
jgi:hypothetical protein